MEVSEQVGSGKTQCPSAVLEAIYGKEVNKKKNYDKSLQRWWKEYAARKNDEEEEHVADSLMYDERCSLPRTVTRPEFENEKSKKEEQ
eukprot:TRINITY_DN4516_c0_g1_i1.p4 TRINITY_DN4516_c0_g1~~TRINITY_DN4516_c0_g1_i1.p4  ORF type:complete len:103 (-),score=18.48 TRINITY_DN4516_c0_g1_i1:427-690(-)